MKRNIAADRIATGILYLAGFLTIVILCLFTGYLLYSGRDSLNLRFLTTSPEFLKAGGGIGPQLFNSLYLLVLSMAVSLPVGLGAGIYMAEYAKPGFITNAIRLCLETLSSLPSIIVGLFGLLIFVTAFGWGFSMLSGAMALMALNLPVIARVTEEAIRSVPGSISEGSLALGATRWQTIWKLLLPSALPGLFSGAILVAGRVFGEAAALMYTAGMSSPTLDFSDMNPLHPASPLNPLRPAETLAVYTWKVNSESLVPDARQIADGSAAILVIAVFVFNATARYLGKKLLRATTAGK